MTQDTHEQLLQQRVAELKEQSLAVAEKILVQSWLQTGKDRVAWGLSGWCGCYSKEEKEEGKRQAQSIPSGTRSPTSCCAGQ